MLTRMYAGDVGGAVQAAIPPAVEDATLVADMSATAAHEALGQGIVVAPFRALFRKLGECLQRAKAPDFTLRPVWALDDGAATG